MGVLSGAARAARPFIAALALAFAAAHLCAWLDTPLPWMVGPLFATAAACMLGAPLAAPIKAREAGQWAIGSALGLYFTAPVVAVIASYAGAIAVAVLFALLLGIAAGELLHRFARVDRATAFFAMAVGGASEMAVQGERHGARIDRVAAAHSLRIMLVVALIPLAVRHWSGPGAGPGLDLFASGAAGSGAVLPGAAMSGAAALDYAGLALLVLLTSVGALALKRLGVPNAWVIGPLLLTMALTVSGIHLSRLPEWMIHAGQLLIGVSLGTRFTPGFVHTAPRYLASVAACALLAMLLAAGFGFGLAGFAGIDPATAILASAPGGIAEMALTAKMLHLGVAVVTAFHVARMVVLVLCIGPIFRLARGFARSGQGD